MRGRRKALLWFSEGIDYPMSEAFSSQSGSEILQATRDAVNAAGRANVNVYALDPRGLFGMTTDLIDSMKSGAPDTMGTDPSRTGGTPFSGTQALISEMRLTQDSLRTLAEGTGGFAAVDTNSFAEALRPHHRRQQPVLLLGYAPPAHPRDGRFHRIEVRTKRPGLQVVARRGYPSPSGNDGDRAQARSARALGARSAQRRRERYVDRASRGAQQRRCSSQGSRSPCTPRHSEARQRRVGRADGRARRRRARIRARNRTASSPTHSKSRSSR